MTTLRVIAAATPRYHAADAIVIDWRRARIYRGGGLVFRLGARAWPHGPNATFRILALLLVAGATRGFASHDELFEAIWGDDPDGGPSCPRTYVARAISSPEGLAFRRALELAIYAERGRGYVVRGVGYDLRQDQSRELPR
jgi:hypothetical protein